MGLKIIECNSQANLMATTEVTWKIGEFYGPLKNKMRSVASCFLSLGETPMETIDLRFYLRYVKNQDNPAHDSYSWEYKRQAKFSGYSLMVDVLSDHTETLLISITREIPDGDNSSIDTKMDAVVLEPNSIKTGLTAMEMFHPCEIWNEYENGDVRSYKFLDKNDFSTSDEEFVLTVACYKMENAGPDNPENKLCETNEASLVSELSQNSNVFQFEPEKCSDLVLTSKDGVKIHAHQFMLAAQSPYLFGLLKSGTTSLSVDVDASPLLALLHYLYHGEFQENFDRYLEDILEAAEKFEMFLFLKTMDNQLIKFASPENKFQLVKLAIKYEMGKAFADLKKIIDSESAFQRNPNQDANLENYEELDKANDCSLLAGTSPREQTQRDQSSEFERALPSSVSLSQTSAAQQFGLSNPHSSSSIDNADIIEMDGSLTKPELAKGLTNDGVTTEDDFGDWVIVTRE